MGASLALVISCSLVAAIPTLATLKWPRIVSGQIGPNGAAVATVAGNAGATDPSSKCPMRLEKSAKILPPSRCRTAPANVVGPTFAVGQTGLLCNACKLAGRLHRLETEGCSYYLQLTITCSKALATPAALVRSSGWKNAHSTEAVKIDASPKIAASAHGAIGMSHLVWGFARDSVSYRRRTTSAAVLAVDLSWRRSVATRAAGMQLTAKCQSGRPGATAQT